MEWEKRFRNDSQHMRSHVNKAAMTSSSTELLQALNPSVWTCPLSSVGLERCGLGVNTQCNPGPTTQPDPAQALKGFCVLFCKLDVL